jgi:HK97 family phage portal protein
LALIDNIKQLFNKQAQKIKGSLPFIMLMGTEKVYGKPQPNDYKAMIASYYSWAYACAWKNATAVAKCKLCLYTDTYDNKKEKKEKKQIIEHPFLDLIKSVNPFSNKFELMTLTTLNLDLTGNAYWFIPKGILGTPQMIWNIPSHWVKVVPSVTEFISGYVVTIPGKPTPIPFDESEIIHFKYPSPSDLFYGQGPLWASRLAIDLSNEMKTWGINFFMNNAQPSGILTTDTSLSEEQYQRLKDQWNEKYKGTKNAGKMAFLENGLKYQQMGSNLRDSRFDNVSMELRDEICAIFGVPASKLGLESHDNRATAEASDYTYQSETIVPKLSLIQEKLNEKLISVYDPRLYCEFENNVGEDKEYKLKERQINLSTGFSSIDELRADDGLDPYDLPETKVPLIPFGLNPAGSPKPEPLPLNPTQPKNVKTVGEDKWQEFARATHPIEKSMQAMIKRYFQKQHGEVIRRLHNFKAINKDLYSSIIFNFEEENRDLKNKSRSYVNQAYVTGVNMAVRETGISLDFTLFNPQILRSVEQRVNFFAEKVNESTAKLLQEQLNQGIEEGEPISEIAKRVDKIFNYSGDYRSLRIAQTEVIGAVNDAQLRIYADAGIKRKKWLTAGDEKVRDSHAVMNGQVVGIGESFTTGDGNHLLCPGDRSGNAPASDIINCRCTVIGVIE